MAPQQENVLTRMSRYRELNDAFDGSIAERQAAADRYRNSQSQADFQAWETASVKEKEAYEAVMAFLKPMAGF